MLTMKLPRKTHSLRDILEIPRTTSKKRVDLPVKLGRMLGNHGKETGWLDVFERKLKQQTRKKCNFQKIRRLGKLFHWKQTLWKFPFPPCFHCHSKWISNYLCELSAFIFVLLFPSLSYLCELFLFVEFVLWIFDTLESFSVNAEFLLVKIGKLPWWFKKYVIAICVVNAPFCI